MNTVITLPAELITHANTIANRRQTTAPTNQAHGCNGGLPEHQLGALGEAAFLAWTGQEWPLTCGTYRSMPDFPRTEVRTRSRSHWDLIIRDDDNPGMAYVLVVPFGSMGAWRLPGWCWGHDAPNIGDRREYGGRESAWFIPQGKLRPMTEYHAAVLVPGET